MQEKGIKKFQNFVKNNINCVIKEDYLLDNVGTFNKKDGSPYTVFTPFRNNGLKFDIKKPNKSKLKNLTKTTKLNESKYIDYKKSRYFGKWWKKKWCFTIKKN